MAAHTRTAAELEAIFNSLVDAAVHEFEAWPEMGLDEDEGEIKLVATAMVNRVENKVLGGYGTFTTGNTRSLSVSISEDEVPVLMELLGNYAQPDDDLGIDTDDPTPVRDSQRTLDMLGRC
jgi:hypothetical protein